MGSAYFELYLVFLFSLPHELGALLLHYSVAVLYNILPDDYYQHHLLLIDGIYLHVKDKVYPGDVRQSERLWRCLLFGPFHVKSYT